MKKLPLWKDWVAIKVSLYRNNGEDIRDNLEPHPPWDLHVLGTEGGVIELSPPIIDFIALDQIGPR